MAKIEALVELPDGQGEGELEAAWPLESYGRNYAMMEDGRVIGAYYTQPEPMRADASCSTYRDGELVPCPEEDRREMIDQSQIRYNSSAKAGEARWFDNADDLPMVMDGGCSYVTVIYNPETETVRAHCNGVV